VKKHLVEDQLLLVKRKKFIHKILTEPCSIGTKNPKFRREMRWGQKVTEEKKDAGGNKLGFEGGNSSQMTVSLRIRISPLERRISVSVHFLLM
jgi:hypothetical protein